MGLTRDNLERTMKTVYDYVRTKCNLETEFFPALKKKVTELCLDNFDLDELKEIEADFRKARQTKMIDNKVNDVLALLQESMIGLTKGDELAVLDRLLNKITES